MAADLARKDATLTAGCQRGIGKIDPVEGFYTTSERIMLLQCQPRSWWDNEFGFYRSVSITCCIDRGIGKFGKIFMDIHANYKKVNVN